MKQNEIQKQYDRQVRRVLKRIADLSEEGYIIDAKKYIRDLKRPTRQSVESLRKITPKYLRKKSGVVDFTSGEIISARASKAKQEALKNNATYAAETFIKTKPTLSKIKTAHEQEKDKRAEGKKPSQQKAKKEKSGFNASDLIIKNFTSIFLGFAPQVAMVIKGITANAIKEYGKDAVAESLMQMPDEIIRKLNDTYDPYDEVVKQFEEGLIGHILDALGGVENPDVIEQYLISEIDNDISW